MYFNSNNLLRSGRRHKVPCFAEGDVLNRISGYSNFRERLMLFDSCGMFPLSVAICDINGLSLINDTLGIEEGERLLEGAGQLITDCVRREDFVALAGGERFLILLPKTQAREATLIISRIIRKCREKREDPDTDLCISISAGCATKQCKGQNISSILQAAEYDLDIQKQRGHKNFYDSLLKYIKKALYEKSHETEEHGDRMVNQSRQLGEALGLAEEQLERLEVLATLHDIGKVSVKKEILMKPGPLNENEWEEIKKHPEAGCGIAMAVPQLKDIAEDILSHHERWDGAGYPNGLSKERIPLLARIISIVDAFDALTSKRCYRNAVSTADALREIERNAGSQFDPHIARVFVNMKRGQDKVL